VRTSNATSNRAFCDLHRTPRHGRDGDAPGRGSAASGSPDRGPPQPFKDAGHGQGRRISRSVVEGERPSAWRLRARRDPQTQPVVGPATGSGRCAVHSTECLRLDVERADTTVERGLKFQAGHKDFSTWTVALTVQQSCSRQNPARGADACTVTLMTPEYGQRTDGVAVNLTVDMRRVVRTSPAP